MKRKTLREQLAEAEKVRDMAIRDLQRVTQVAAKSDARVKLLESLVLAYKRFSLKVCMQRDLKHDAPPHSHAIALKESMEAGVEVERLSRELWPEAYAALDAKAAGMITETEGDDPKWN